MHSTFDIILPRDLNARVHKDSAQDPSYESQTVAHRLHSVYRLGCNILCYFLKCLNRSGFAEGTTPTLNDFNHKQFFLNECASNKWQQEGRGVTGHPGRPQRPNHKYLFLVCRPVIGWGSAGFYRNPLTSDRIYLVTICKKDGSRCSTCLLCVRLQKEPFIR